MASGLHDGDDLLAGDHNLNSSSSSSSVWVPPLPCGHQMISKTMKASQEAVAD